jgi:ribosomal protein L34
MQMKGIFSQERYQGDKNRQPYFEGWYFRMVTPNGRNICFIPGVSLNPSDSHCFIQMIDSQGECRYFRYPLSSFEYSKSKFYIKIGENTFSADGFKLDIKADLSISGEVTLKNTVPYPKSITCPGIMGPFSYLPILECRHSVINIKSSLEGEISINGEKIKLTGGTGYVEKDWGSSFPNPYIWAQSCGFDGHETSFMMSAARVPVFGMSLKGLIAFLYLDGKIYRFATYNGAAVKEIVVGDNVNLIIKSPAYKLGVCLMPDEGQVLKAPANGVMSREIRESSNGRISLKLQKDEKTIFCGEGQNSGIEICGDILALK